MSSGGNTPSPITQAPAPGVTPPVTTTNAEVVQAQNDLRRLSLRKRGFAKTTLAGDTGGWHAPGAPTPNKPAMGGGLGTAGKLG